MKILIAGGAGYLGSVLSQFLLKKGFDVEIIDLLWFGNHLPKEIKIIKKDLFDCRESELANYEQIIFLAGISNDPMAEFNPSLNIIFNRDLPIYLASTAKKAGVKRFIHGSSCSVYGFTNNQLFDETSPTLCNYPYGIAKLQAENGIHAISGQNFSVISLRQGTLSGHSPRMRMDLFINTMFMTAIIDKKIIINNPSIWRPVFCIKDAINAHLCAINSDYSLSGIFNVASENITIGEAGEIVKKELELFIDRQIDIKINNTHDLRNYRVSTKKAESLLGFKKRNTIKDILKDLCKHIEYYGNFDKDIFNNFKTFEKIEDKLKRHLLLI